MQPEAPPSVRLLYAEVYARRRAPGSGFKSVVLEAFPVCGMDHANERTLSKLVAEGPRLLCTASEWAEGAASRAALLDGLRARSRERLRYFRLALCGYGLYPRRRPSQSLWKRVGRCQGSTERAVGATGLTQGDFSEFLALLQHSTFPSRLDHGIREPGASETASVSNSVSWLRRVKSFVQGVHAFLSAVVSVLVRASPLKQELVFIRFRLSSPRQSCGHQPYTCKVVCDECGRPYLCAVCHDEHEEHHFVPGLQPKMICLMCGEEGGLETHCQFCGRHVLNYCCKACGYTSLFPQSVTGFSHCGLCGTCHQVYGAGSFYCSGCRLCFPAGEAERHSCAPSDKCCILCLDPLTGGRKRFQKLPCGCGNYVHAACMQSMLDSGEIRCPVCLRYILDAGRRAIFEEQLGQTLYRFLLKAALGAKPVSIGLRSVRCRECGKEGLSVDARGICRCPHCRTFNVSPVFAAGVSNPSVRLLLRNPEGRLYVLAYCTRVLFTFIPIYVMTYALILQDDLPAISRFLLEAGPALITAFATIRRKK